MASLCATSVMSPQFCRRRWRTLQFRRRGWRHGRRRPPEAPTLVCSVVLGGDVVQIGVRFGIILIFYECTHNNQPKTRAGKSQTQAAFSTTICYHFYMFCTQNVSKNESTRTTQFYVGLQRLRDLLVLMK